jgi:hypothetical protein
MVRWGRPAVVLVAVAAGVLVALAASGEPMRAATGTQAGELPDWVLVVPVLGVVIAAIGAVIVLREGRGEWRPTRRRSILPTLMMIAFAALLASLIARPDEEDRLDEPSEPEPTAVADAGEPSERTSWPVWMLVAGAGAVVAIAVLLHRRSAPRATEALPEDEDAAPGSTAVRVVTSSVDALSAAGDPRSGVIAAYGRLLAGLGDAGAERRSDEAPFEHVTRALRDLGVRAEPLQRLTALFAEARFSTHPITEQHRAEAQSCLQAALDDLESLPCA